MSHQKRPSGDLSREAGIGEEWRREGSSQSYDNIAALKQGVEGKGDIGGKYSP